MIFGSLFSGIGGIDLGLERAGMTCRWQVEIDDFCRRVLAKHWPTVTRYDDIRSLDWSTVEPVDLVAGGFPCQPVSTAGKRLAQADPRWLWPEFARAIRLLRPKYVLVENVPGLLVRGFGDVLGDLAEAGYDAEWDCVSAADVGAPHLRRRVFLVGTRTMDHAMPRGHDLEDAEPSAIAASDWQKDRLSSATGIATANAANPISAELRDESRRRNGQNGTDTAKLGNNGAAGLLAYSDQEHGNNGRHGASPLCGERSGTAALFDLAATDGPRELQPGRGIGSQWGRAGHCDWWDVEPDVGRVAHGVPSRVDRLRALGNAVVPQVAEVVGRQILAAARRSVLDN
jgi:DNA (cytosine-5)-methyltransferase 1